MAVKSEFFEDAIDVSIDLVLSATCVDAEVTIGTTLLAEGEVDVEAQGNSEVRGACEGNFKVGVMVGIPTGVRGVVGDEVVSNFGFDGQLDGLGLRSPILYSVNDDLQVGRTKNKLIEFDQSPGLWAYLG